MCHHHPETNNHLGYLNDQQMLRHREVMISFLKTISGASAEMRLLPLTHCVFNVLKKEKQQQVKKLITSILEYQTHSTLHIMIGMGFKHCVHTITLLNQMVSVSIFQGVGGYNLYQLCSFNRWLKRSHTLSNFTVGG